MARQRKDKRRFAGRIEQLEDRRVMSADSSAALMPPLEQHDLSDDVPAYHHGLDDGLPPVDQHVLGDADFWIDSSYQKDLEHYFGDVSQMLTQAHNLTGWFNVRSNYGFTGLGQTVAVIDSGIAWNHFALGGGLGANYRVVGGWDFTEENDSNPYDDGASGSHGTHVSGIIGSSDANNTGVAPGVDLVGLRVFNDAGQGFFSWIENALQWVHTNRNAFENPITAVNLSLGVSSWNDATVPAWANLEDELAQLEADGIFIAVSAGNSYTTYNMPGLSYPAASPYVVPVMSTDDAGNMSSFSQRLGRAIAAPGQNIVSTVPDYNGNNNGIADDFGAKGGTSMAAPYVAGASVLIRQAMQFVGMTNITQDMIYDHMMATADTFFDAVTSTNYKRLNLGRAIDQLMPADDYGSTSAAAFNLGTISGPTTTNGQIANLTDVDCFRFTAGGSGKITFTATCGAGMTPTWQVWGATPLGGQAAGAVAFNVTAGQTYTIGLSGSRLGSYSIGSTLEAGFTFTDWGSVASSVMNNVNVAGEAWYRVTATRTGLLSVQGDFNAAGGTANVALYNASLQLVANGVTSGGQARVDAAATASGVYYVRVTGANSDVDFKLLNLVSQSGTTVTVAGTAAADAFGLTAGSTHWLSINGMIYSFAGGAANTFNFDLGGGNDSLSINGTSADETFRLRVGSTQVTAAAYNVSATNVEYVTAVGGGGGGDKAILYDGAGNDLYECWTDHAVMSGAGYASTAQGFWQYYGYGSTGNDRAILHDTAGADTYESRADRATLTGAGYLAYSYGFDIYDAYASGGADRAIMYDTAGDDVFEARTDRSQMSSAGYLARAYGFDDSYGYASTGADVANIYDSAAADTWETKADRGTMRGGNYLAYAWGFDRYNGYASGPADKAIMYDSTGNDVFEAWLDHAQMTGGGAQAHAYGFKQAYGYASSGTDQAIIHDTAGNDTLRTYYDRVVMRGGTYLGYAYGFDQFDVHSSDGHDKALMYDSAGNDVFETRPERSTMSGAGYVSIAHWFDETYGYSSTGVDHAMMYDSAGTDEYRAWWDRVMMKSPWHLSYAYYFAQTSAFAGGALDRAIIYDSTGNDLFTSWMGWATMEGAGYRNNINGFGQSFGYASGGYDRAVFYDSALADILTVRAWGSSLRNGAVQTQAQYFEELDANNVNGGTDVADVVAVDYLFDLIGDWS